MTELTNERIAKWHPDWSIGGNKIWSHIEDPLPGRGFPRWLDPESNDWVELLEVLQKDDHLITFEWSMRHRQYVCKIGKLRDTADGYAWIHRESFLAALAQMLDAQGDG